MMDNPDLLFVQLHNLQMVAAVAARRSISGAARDLCRSPSVVTRGVAEVESALGTALFERKVGGFVPNWRGRLLLGRIRRIEEEITAVTAELGRSKLAGSLSPASLKHLLYNGHKLLLLTHLADARSASGAAGTMAITQSGVSMALSRLEEAVGLRLFFRNLQGMTPTDAGAKLILRARRMRAELRHGLAELASATGEPTGTVVIGALPLARTDILPRAISHCLDQAPGIQIEAVEAPAETLILRLLSDEIDIVLTVPLPQFDPRGLIVEPLFDDDLVVVAASGHPLAQRHGLTLCDLAGQRWILPGLHSASRAIFKRQLQEQSLQLPRAAVHTADLALIRQLLMERQDILALTSRVLVHHEISTGVIVPLDLALQPMARKVVMLRREGALHPPAVVAMIAKIREMARGAPTFEADSTRVAMTIA